MNLAHGEEYAGHPILKLFTRPVEMENGVYMRMSKEDIAHMNAESEKKLTYDTLNVAMSLHERHKFHIAVATDGGSESMEILKNKRKEATTLQKRLGVTLNQVDKARAVEQGVLN
eukprot:4693359-Pleurochrysis_carterae.AAC.1